LPSRPLRDDLEQADGGALTVAAKAMAKIDVEQPAIEPPNNTAERYGTLYCGHGRSCMPTRSP
jgi:hypothetical protein